VALIAVAGALMALVGIAVVAAAVGGYRGGEPTWDVLTTGLFAGLGLVFATLAVGLDVLIVRQCVLGLPSVEVELAGLRVGSELIAWQQVHSWGVFRSYGETFLGIDVDASALGGLRLIDRGLAAMNVRAGLPPLMLSRQQLGSDTLAATQDIERLRGG
jgi:hypothetical protein